MPSYNMFKPFEFSFASCFPVSSISGHWTNGGTGVCNFNRCDREVYKQAVEEYCDKQVWVSDRPIDGSSDCCDDMCSLHHGEHGNLSEFHHIVRRLKEERDAMKQYRLLSVGEVVEEGDEFFNEPLGVWVKTSYAGRLVKYPTYRREVEDESSGNIKIKIDVPTLTINAGLGETYLNKEAAEEMMNNLVNSPLPKVILDHPSFPNYSWSAVVDEDYPSPYNFEAFVPLQKYESGKPLETATLNNISWYPGLDPDLTSWFTADSSDENYIDWRTTQETKQENQMTEDRARKTKELAIKKWEWIVANGEQYDCEKKMADALEKDVPEVAELLANCSYCEEFRDTYSCDGCPLNSDQSIAICCNEYHDWFDNGRKTSDAIKMLDRVKAIEIKKGVELPSIWDIVNNKCNYIAKDEDGDWCCYNEKPFIESADKSWGHDGEYFGDLVSLDTSLFREFQEEIDWSDSLIVRPGYKEEVKLLPCPLCGDEMKYTRTETGGWFLSHGDVDSCSLFGISNMGTSYNTKEGVAEEWNQRSGE